MWKPILATIRLVVRAGAARPACATSLILALDFYRLDIYGILQISQCQDTEVQGQVCCYALHFQREALR